MSNIFHKFSVVFYSCLSLGGVTAFAGESAVLARPNLIDADKSFCDQLTSWPVFYEDKDSFIRKVKLNLRGQYQMVSVNPNGANHFREGSGGHNAEWRRTYLGAQIWLGDGTWRLSNLTNVGGMEGRKSEKGGRWSHSHTDWSLYELYLEKTLPGVKVLAGKLTPHITYEYCQSSSAIKTIERSALCNQLSPVSNWGIEANFQKDKRSLYHSYGVYLNANGPELNEELQFHSEDNLFAMISLRYPMQMRGMDANLAFQYAHNFTEWRGQKKADWSDYQGIGAQDVLSLSWDMKAGEHSVMVNALAGIGVVGQPGAKNVYGVVFQHVMGLGDLGLSEHMEYVFQYQYGTGDGSVKMNSRYVPNVTSYAGWVDSMHSFYWGLNFYLCPKSINTAKFMLGAEYVTGETSRAGAKAFDGWSIMGALRFNF